MWARLTTMLIASGPWTVCRKGRQIFVNTLTKNTTIQQKGGRTNLATFVGIMTGETHNDKKDLPLTSLLHTNRWHCAATMTGEIRVQNITKDLLLLTNL